MQIESFEKGCEIMGYDPAQKPIVAHLPAIHQKAVTSAYELFVISEASWKGEGKEPDYDNESERKWEPIFYLKKDKSNPSGFRFDGSICVDVFTNAASGSRLCYPSRADSDWHAQRHEGLYRDVLVKKK
jgi:hypothetical protein